MTESRTFDPTRPFLTRDGREVTDLRAIDAGPWRWQGKVDGIAEAWRSAGEWLLHDGSGDSGHDLVNVDEPTPDASTQSFIDCVKTENADLKHQLEKALAVRPPIEPVTFEEDRRAIELYSETPSFRVVIEDFLARREMKR